MYRLSVAIQKRRVPMQMYPATLLDIGVVTTIDLLVDSLGVTSSTEKRRK